MELLEDFKKEEWDEGEYDPEDENELENMEAQAKNGSAVS
jgi:hypothetical protein